MWIKLIAYLKLTHRFGFIIKIIENNIMELFNMLMLYSIIIAGFSSITYYILYEYNN
jgi:hypothetical protein